MKKYIIVLGLIVIIAGFCQYTKKPTPKLVVYIAVDHLSYDTFEQYKDLYTGGFKWLIDHGVQFENIHHEHGNTSTGPGHFVLGSGQHPGPVGIVGNSWWNRDQKRSVYCVEDHDAKAVFYEGEGFSYRNINTTGLGDWIKKKDPESKVYSVAGKERPAVFMGGKNADLALYYNWQGSFITSDYYADTIPDWLIHFNDNLHINTYRDSIWTRSLSPEIYDEYAHKDDFYGETDRYQSDTYSPVFPIGFDNNLSDSDILGKFFDFPWMERATIQLAKAVFKNEKLGRDDHPDYLFVGLSGTDAIHHYYGPYSHEGMDNLIKIDQYLGDFISFIHQHISENDVVYILTADHGGSPLPEHLTAKGISAGRVNRDERNKAYETVLAYIEEKYGYADLVTKYGSNIYYDLNQLNEYKIDSSTLDEIFIDHLMKIDGVASVFTNEEIESADPDNEILRRLKNSYHQFNSPDILVLYKPYWQNRSPYGTGHGTPYDYDSHVPLIISHANSKSKTDYRSAASVDIAPTVADILNVTPEKADGKSLLKN